MPASTWYEFQGFRTPAKFKILTIIIYDEK